jgi:enoyl-CoA hydratase
MTADPPLVRVSRDARGVATVVLDNAAKLNTLSTSVMTALIEAVERLGTDPDLRVVVLRGAGERAFIGGADISEMARLDADSARAFITRVHCSCALFRCLPVPVIARIQGYVLGAGLEIAAACDIRVAASDAVFGMPEVRIGVPSVVEAALLPHLIGWGRTRRLLLTGDTIDAPRALDWGLIEDCVAPDQLDATVAHLVASILASGPHAVRSQKALINDWQDLKLADAVQRGIDSFAAAWNTDEPSRMMADFLAQMRARKPR